MLDSDSGSLQYVAMNAEIDHLILPVNSAAESVAFYTEIVGFCTPGVCVDGRCGRQMQPFREFV